MYFMLQQQKVDISNLFRIKNRTVNCWLCNANLYSGIKTASETKRCQQ